MRNPRKKAQKWTKEEKVIIRKKLVTVNQEGIIQEFKKEPKHKNIGIKLMKKYGIHTKKRGVGITREIKSGKTPKQEARNKVARKMSAKSRKINRGK